MKNIFVFFLIPFLSSSQMIFNSQSIYDDGSVEHKIIIK